MPTPFIFERIARRGQRPRPAHKAGRCVRRICLLICLTAGFKRGFKKYTCQSYSMLGFVPQPNPALEQPDIRKTIQ